MNRNKVVTKLHQLGFTYCTLIVVLVGCRCGGPQAQVLAHGRINRGSCLVALAEAAESVIAFAKSHGNVLPYSSDGAIVALKEAGVDETQSRRVLYINRPDSNLLGNSRMIMIICKEELAQEQGGERYVALLSGAIVAVPSHLAKLGANLPSEIGRVVLKPPSN